MLFIIFNFVCPYRLNRIRIIRYSSGSGVVKQENVVCVGRWTSSLSAWRRRRVPAVDGKLATGFIEPNTSILHRQRCSWNAQI